MNLLIDPWIPVRPQEGGAPRPIDLKTLLCDDGRWELALPRDDMELAALQMLICLVQVFWMPEDKPQWKQRLRQPLPEKDFATGIEPYLEWFQLNHPQWPFMQVRGVQTDKTTPLDKLVPIDTSTNSCFVNPPGLVENLCWGCAAIALYNRANNAPSFGGGQQGGFKFGIRSNNKMICPVTTLIQGPDLRSTIWINVLTRTFITEHAPEPLKLLNQPPTWVEPIPPRTTIPATPIGLLRGLFWQPCHVELLWSTNDRPDMCDCCGQASKLLSYGFKKAQFKYKISGLWPHPHSPRILTVNKGKSQHNFAAFKDDAPAWTQLSRFVYKRQWTKENKEGWEPALTVQQIQFVDPSKVELLIGGYRNSQASILERRHEVLTLNRGWERHTATIDSLVDHALRYRDALTSVVFLFSNGNDKKDIKGVRLVYKEQQRTKHSLTETARAQFYRRSETVILEALATIDFDHPQSTFKALDDTLGRLCRALFEDITRPYLHQPELMCTYAICKRSLERRLKENRNAQPTEATP